MNDYVELSLKTLTALGYDPGAIDGLAGPRTAAAVAQFQRDAGLPVDGMVGPMTKEALLMGLGVRAHPMPWPDGLVLMNFSPV